MRKAMLTAPFEDAKYGILLSTVKYWITGSVWCLSRRPVMGWRPLFYPARPEKEVDVWTSDCT